MLFIIHSFIHTFIFSIHFILVRVAVDLENQIHLIFTTDDYIQVKILQVEMPTLVTSIVFWFLHKLHYSFRTVIKKWIHLSKKQTNKKANKRKTHIIGWLKIFPLVMSNIPEKVCFSFTSNIRIRRWFSNIFECFPMFISWY